MASVGLSHLDRLEAGADGESPSSLGVDDGPAAVAVVQGLVQDVDQRSTDLYYAEQITAEYFAEEEQRISAQPEVVRVEAFDHVDQTRQASGVAKHFEQVSAVLETMDLDAIWDEATDQGKRVHVEEMVEEVAMFPDHLRWLWRARRL